MNNLRKKIITFLFVLGLSISCSCIFTTNVKKVVASESSTSEISKDMLSVKCQISENVTTNLETSKLRIVSTIDSLDYQSAGFDITYKGKEIPYNTTKVYESIEAVSDGVDYNYSPNVFDIDSKYFITVTLINLQQEDYYEGILIKPYVVMKSGGKVYGTHRYVSVADALDNTVLNIPVEMSTSEDSTFTVSDGNASYNLEAKTETQKSYYYDGTYTHFRIDTDRTALNSVTSFTFSDGTNTGTATYRNLNNSYDGTANTADITWYDENSDYNVIATSADLYGFVALSLSKNFNLETIYLGADIVVNEGTSAEWLSNAADEDNTNDAYAWLPIATSMAFAGKFDGQGHTISGLYVNTSSNSQGLFSQTTDDSKIMDLRLENSYFKTTLSSGSNACVGGISSKGSGTFDSIYVGDDVEIISGGKLAGGIIGRVNDSGTAIIQSCWFAGSVNVGTAERGGGIVGGVGDSETATATISHCLNSGSVTTSKNSNQVRLGGICGVAAGKASVTIEDCLNVGTISSSVYTGSDIQLGAILGFKGGNASATILNNTYSTSDSCTPTENAGYNSSNSYAKEAIIGFAGYKLSQLSFEATGDSIAYWVVRANDTPALASLVDSAIRTIPSTEWHDEPESVEADGTKVYTISTLKDLYGFSKLSAEGESFEGEKIQLGADIKVNKGLAASWAKYAPNNEWLPIGKTTPFAGAFDGQDHTIDGIYIQDSENKLGMFAQTADDSSVRNLRLENSYISSTLAEGNSVYVGSIAGYGLGDFDTIYSNAIIDCGGIGCGGIVGRVDGTGENEITNSWFDGSITIFATENESRTGGIVGELNSGTGKLIISHCLNSGTINTAQNTSSSKNTRIGGICSTVGGSYLLQINDSLSVGRITDAGSTKTTIGSVIGFVGSNASASVTTTYGSSDSYSDFKSSSGSGLSESSEYGNKDTEDILGEAAYTNTYLEFDSAENSALFDGHWVIQSDATPVLRSFVDEDVIAVPSYIKANTRWYTKATEDASEYTISLAEELYGLASLVNNGNTFEGKTIRLEKDIVVNSGESSEWNDGSVTPTYSWTQIGNGAGKPFAGTFDGQNHTISGVYLSESGNSANNIALFGITSVNATIKNIILENSCFKGNKAVGAIAGQGGGTFDTIHVKEDVYLTSSDRWCGGIIAVLCPIVSGESATVDSPNKITNCWFSGTLKAGRYGAGMAGSIGKHGTDTAAQVTAQGRVTTVAVIEHCLNTGIVTHTGLTTTDAANLTRTGGLCGAIVSTDSSTYSIVTIEDCLNIGVVTSEIEGATNYGDIYGHVYNNTKITLTDVYATDESCSADGANNTTQTTTQGSITRGFATSDIKGYDAYSLSLDYANYWVARNGDTPVLGDFADTNVLVSGDTAWYDEHTGTEDDKYIIDSVEELYGFAKLSYNENTFEDEIIYLGANIAVNSGNSSEWETALPVNEWIPIGNGISKAFAGTFNGQGYTISGLYADGTSSNIGLFGCTTADANIMNLTIENTYFRGKKAIGAVAGQGGGTFDTIHIGSDVYLESTGNWCGGIIALIKTDSVTEGSSTDTHTITNCWFEGTLRAERYGGGMTGSVGKFEDDTTAQIRYASNATITNCLNTGTIVHTGVSTKNETARTGGLVGAVVSNATKASDEETGETIITATLTSILTIEDCFCAGSVSSEISEAQNYGSVVGHIFNGSEITCADVYATRECSASSYIANSSYVDETNVTITRHFEEQMKGFSGYVNTFGLVYDNAYLATAGSGTWVAVCGDYPVLKSFSDGYTAVDFSPFALEGSVVADMVNQGGGNAVITVSGDYRTDYLAKIAGDGGLGFETCYSNSIGSDDKSISTSSYKKDDLVITVTYVAGTNTTYISAGSDVEFSKYLSLDTVAKEGGDTTSGEMSLSMLQLKNAAGSTYIMQLENGHFIIEDGGQTETDYANFVAYLYELTGGEKPIIDAWIISHAHVDHYGILDYVDSNGDGVADDFYVEGFYYTQASAESSNASKIINRTKLCRTTTEDVPEVYRMYAGQTYYFDGVTMEVLLTHEQLTGYTDFNETSVWCKYTIGTETSAQTFLNGADSSTVGMEFLMDAYSADYLYCDIFAALHHGVNTSTDFTDFLEGNSVASGYAVDDVVLYSRMSDPTDSSGYLPDDGSDDESGSSNLWDDLKKAAQRVLLQGYNNDLIGEVKNSVSGSAYYYYGLGTAKLTFTSDGITGEYIQLEE